ncbi:hypothetical protein HYV71_02045 [Candidatus Uhrbacteria bacterium]|nr:hypothetical protein [Candidatus Uhrbacteria bacterium]
MDTINISLNQAIKTKLKPVMKRKGYNNVSEYIRDLLRRDLNLEHHDSYQYDTPHLERLAKEAKNDVRQKKIKKLTSLADLA